VDQPILEKDLEKEEPKSVYVEVIIHTDYRQFPIELGNCTPEQLESVHTLIRAAFETLAPTRGLTFVDKKSRTFHFNTSHVACVEINFR
jgi:hypothetical protein